MQIGATGSAYGLSATGSAIQRGQERFDAQAQQVVDTTTALANEQPVGSEALTEGVVGLREEQRLNEVLYGVFKQQQQQQQTLIDLVGRP